MRSLSILLLALPFIPSTVLADTLQSVISAYSLNAASFNLTAPTTALNSDDATSWIVSKWGVVGGKLDWGSGDVVFSPDPATSTSTLVKRQSGTIPTSSLSRTTSSIRSSTSSSSSGGSAASPAAPAQTVLSDQPPVLRVGYPQGSYSKRTGGTQFTSNVTAILGSDKIVQKGDSYERMLLSYDIWFPSGYNFNLGGKLPGLRGGPDRYGCSGGNQTDGTGCFSTRLMWRQNAAGEVYAYIPPTNSLCSQAQTICNSDYGISLGRGQFGFVTGQWQTLWLLVVLNEVGKANGLIELWYNGVPALQFPQSILRTSSSINSITGLFFSTFFGGDDSSWATPTQQYTYYKNIQLFAGKAASGTSGSAVSTSGSGSGLGSRLNIGSGGVWGVVAGVGLGLVGLVSVGLL